MSDIQLYRTYLADYLQRFHGITNLKDFFHCVNPNHFDNHPSMKFTNKYNICKCFSCEKYYDIFDLVGIDFDLPDFKDQIKKVEELYCNYIPEYKNYDYIDNRNYDYINYYKKCVKNINQTDYLENRGITKKLIKKYSIGFDSKKNLIIFPINRNCYFARSTVNNDKLKSKGSSDIWNKQLLDDSDNLIYVTEGIIDSLSLEVIDPSIKTISINGVGNIKTLVRAIEEKNFTGSIVIAFDNDKAGIQATKDLKEMLKDLNVNCFSTTLVSNFDSNECKDINKALIINKELLEKNYHYYNDNFNNFLEKNKAMNGDELIIE